MRDGRAGDLLQGSSSFQPAADTFMSALIALDHKRGSGFRCLVGVASVIRRRRVILDGELYSLGDLGPCGSATTLKAKSTPADTPPEVMTLPSRTILALS